MGREHGYLDEDPELLSAVMSVAIYHILGNCKLLLLSPPVLVINTVSSLGIFQGSV